LWCFLSFLSFLSFFFFFFFFSSSPPDESALEDALLEDDAASLPDVFAAGDSLPSLKVYDWSIFFIIHTHVEFWGKMLTTNKIKTQTVIVAITQ
jgi:hypothetical protein